MNHQRNEGQTNMDNLKEAFQVLMAYDLKVMEMQKTLIMMDPTNVGE